MNPWNLNLPQGAASPVDEAAAHRRAAELVELERNRRVSNEPQPKEWRENVTYGAKYNDSAQKPTDGSDEGLPTNFGRIWAEGRALENSVGAGTFKVTLVSTQNGVAALVECPGASTLVAGSIRYWKQNPATKKWGLSSQDIPLPVGEASAWSPEDFITVGSR